jgi:hypothetical protein
VVFFAAFFFAGAAFFEGADIAALVRSLLTEIGPL